MTRREAIAKATITTADTAAGALEPAQGRAFVRAIRDRGVWGRTIRQEVRGVDSGETQRLGIGSRLLRGKAENTDDGYRAGISTSASSFQTVKVWLPWEVTEDVFHDNIEGGGLEDSILSEMTTQFGLDLDDLDINGDSAFVGADSAFVNIDDGVLKKITAANVAGRRIDGALINGGDIAKEHFQAAKRAMPNKYFNQGGMRWFASPTTATAWEEYLTDRGNSAGDAILGGERQGAAGLGALRGPLGIPFVGVTDDDGVYQAGIPSWPDGKIVLAQPRNFTRVVSWQVRRRKVTGETDAGLAARDKRFYVFFVKRTITIEELDAVVEVRGVNVT